ncbi:C40 family peptidase [Lysobacter ciconiae]|uniref:C40 family peptidase n=2 Tax=Lysobacterales TaxID=135614 RepID=A0A7S6UH93_9GAMM|nr:C40 family peptidase [Lysobacter ciconiae]
MIAPSCFSDDRVTTLLSSRPARTTATSARRRPAGFSLFLAALLALPALPALATQSTEAPMPSMADMPVMMPDAMSMPDRALSLASDISGMLASGKAAAVAEDYTPPDHSARNILQRALTLLGTPYRWGGNTPDKGFDCSGLVSYVFRNAMGIDLPRVSREQANSGELVASKKELAEGDLVFFGRKGRIDHVGIYVGEGRFVHAPSTGKDVMVSSLEKGYWSGKYMQARRLAGS